MKARQIAANIAKLRRVNPITRPRLTFCQKLSASGSVSSAVVVLSHGKKSQMFRKTLIIPTAIAALGLGSTAMAKHGGGHRSSAYGGSVYGGGGYGGGGYSGSG
jgi:uncharacterized membrane protein